MVNKWTKTMMISLVVVLVMSVGAIAVFAQTDDTETPDADRPAVPFGRGFRGDMGDRLAYLADALGISSAELETAQQQAHAAQLADAVEEGLLTQDQANTILAMQALKSYIDKDVLLADALGISVEELQAAKDDGTLRDLLADITPAELQEKMQAGVEAAIAQAVEDKVITQEQADLVLAQMADGSGFGHFGGHHGRGRGGSHGGGRGRGGFPGGFGSENTNFAPSGASSEI